ncbi:MAG: ABC-F family ATP-binding cassette domain-containing protein, partial [Kiritimatiellae bacterium]|nr:ABC-F family ATP-binding cassette domain-containing protein [Kiritimatiellia bacterium]
MIDFIGVSQQFGGQTVLDAASFRINPGERVGVVGPNGAGKSTIFALIAGELSPQQGEVVTPRNTRLGWLRQHLSAHATHATLVEFTQAQPALDALRAEWSALEHAPAATPEAERARLRRIGEIQHEFEHLGGYALRSRAEAALSGLGFPVSDFNRPFREFSGGWQMRAEMARTLIGAPDLLMLDEPSNYLDLPAVEWLQRFLRSFAGTLLLISHDRYLLRSLTDRTLEVHGGQTVKYPGGYDFYLKERETRYEQQRAARRKYVEHREHLEQFIRRFRAQASKAALVQSRIKQLEKLPEVKAPPAPPDLSHLRIASPPHCGRHVLRMKGAGMTYDGRRWIFRGVDLELSRGDKVAVVGYNGMGKTTMIRAMAGALPLSEGERIEGHQVVVGYQSQDVAETMPPDRTAFSIVRSANPDLGEREARTLLGSFGFSGEAAEKRCDVLSGGERIRLAFARLFARPPNLLLLDEPTTHLDIHGREALERAIREYEGTVCLVSHDVTFVRNTVTRIIAIGPEGVAVYPGGYD